MLITTFVFQDYPQGYILSYFYKLFSALSLSKLLVEFSLKLACYTICGKNSQIYGVHIPEKCIESRLFYSCPVPLPLDRRKLLILTGSIFWKICFPQQQKGVEETMICFIKIWSENMKMTWNIKLLYLYDL